MHESTTKAASRISKYKGKKTVFGKVPKEKDNPIA
jgi:hypothetical protein